MLGGERGTPQQHTPKRNTGEALKTEHLGKKKCKECYGTSATQKMLGTMNSTGNDFLHLLHIEFRTTELYVYYP